MNELDYHEHVQRSRWLKKALALAVIIFLIIPLTVFFAYFFVSGPAENFKVGEVFEIREGMNVSEIADFLEKEGYIKSASVFKLYDRWERFRGGDESGIKAGRYTFKNEEDIFGVYRRLKNGISGIEDVKVRIMEGDPNFLIAETFEKNKKFKNFSKERFLELAKNKEGYLYPDTYSFSPYVSEETIIKTMEDNFYKKAGKIVDRIEKSNKSLNKIITMASLIEKEAGNAPRSVKKRVSGVLWRRIELGMPLQVDAVFDYIYQKHLSRILFSHLKVDSPYNTYQNKGLPPGPIGNPSISAIEAAMYPTPTKDLFYITGKDGKFYFSRTSAGHYDNISKYRTNYKKSVVEEEDLKNDSFGNQGLEN